MTVFDKLKWALAILLVFVLVLATNLVDRNHFHRIAQSVQTIYADRVVANDLLFDMAALVHEKELALERRDTAFFRSRAAKVDAAMDGFLERYAQTYLTADERLAFDDLRAHLDALRALEARGTDPWDDAGDRYRQRLAEIREDLRRLSKIQLVEGQRQVSLSERSMETMALFTRIEIVFLVLLAVLVQVIILYRPPRRG